MLTLTAIVPFYNEENCLKESVERLTVENIFNKILLIDNRFGWGVVPELNSSCWINIECIPEEKSVSFSENIINIFYLLDQKK